MEEKFLEKLLGTQTYNLQKKIFRDIQKKLTFRAKDALDNAYVIQKEVLREVVDDAKKEAYSFAVSIVEKNYDKTAENIGKKIPFFGKYITAALKKHRPEILDMLFSGSK